MDDETQGPSQGEKITNLAAISLGLNVGKQLTAGDFGGKKKMKIKMAAAILQPLTTDTNRYNF